MSGQCEQRAGQSEQNQSMTKGPMEWGTRRQVCKWCLVFLTLALSVHVGQLLEAGPPAIEVVEALLMVIRL